jgi:hypothetical protein
MTVYVDQLKEYPVTAISKRAQKWGQKWCHMWSDDIDQLHAMAKHIGLKQEYFQDGKFKHYDLIPFKRAKAIEFGAIEMSLKDWLRRE